MNRMSQLTLVASLLTTPAAVQCQFIAPPSTGVLVSYQYWPVQYVQWVGTELSYSMIEFDVDNTGKQPLYNVVLTERASGKRITYANTDALVAAAKSQGMTAFKTQIAFDAAETTNVGAASTLRLSLADGRPLQWRFIQGSDVSDQGAGLTPLPAAPMPIFAYREQAAVAGEGTALQVGDAVSAAEVWPEISHPPQFIAYRGAMSLNAHTAVLAAGKETWTITSAPTALKVGSVWELDSDNGDHRTLRVDKMDGAHFAIGGTDRSRQTTSFTIDCSRAGDAWSVERLRYAPVHDGEKHYLALQFNAPLSATASASNVDLTVGRKTKVASATMTVAGTPETRIVTMQMQTPQWAKGKTLREETTWNSTTFTTVSTVPK